MTPYSSIISDALTEAGYPHHTDPATLALVEDCMRTQRTGLDHLSREDFLVEVAIIIGDLVTHPDHTRTLCDLLGFALPAWLDGPHQPATVLPWHATSRHVLTALQAAFPTTRFCLTSAHGEGHGHALLRWTGGPARASVADVVAQFLPSQARPGTPRYGLVAIYLCRINALTEKVGS